MSVRNYSPGDKDQDILRKLVDNQAGLPASNGDSINNLFRKLLLNQVSAGAGPGGGGIPTGGSIGQVLAKKTSADYDTEWKTVTSGSGGNSYFPGGW